MGHIDQFTLVNSQVVDLCFSGDFDSSGVRTGLGHLEVFTKEKNQS